MTLDDLHDRRAHAIEVQRGLQSHYATERHIVWWARFAGFCSLLGIVYGLTQLDNPAVGVPFIWGVGCGINGMLFFKSYVPSERRWQDYLHKLHTMPSLIENIDHLIHGMQHIESKLKNEDHA